jgi:hypothetical protein
MAPYDDEDDWVGEPAEGFHSRERAKPEFWRGPWRLAGIGLATMLLILIVVVLAH